MMVLSHNEVENLVYKAAEANGLGDGVCVALMRAAAYLESAQIGADAPGALVELLDFFDGKQFGGAAMSKPRYAAAGDGVTVDLRGDSCLLHLTALAALARGQARRGRRVVFVGARHLVFILPHLLGGGLALQLRGMSCAWLFRAGCSHPVVLRADESALGDVAQADGIVVPASTVAPCAVSDDNIVANRFDASLKQGISVESRVYQRLAKYANQILVPI